MSSAHHGRQTEDGFLFAMIAFIPFAQFIPSGLSAPSPDYAQWWITCIGGGIPYKVPYGDP